MFRFEDLEIWKRAADVACRLFDVADKIEERKLFRFADQLRGAGLSMPNNIAEGSGSISDKEFAQFLNIARRSTFENANMVIIFARRGLLTAVDKDSLLVELDELCRRSPPSPGLFAPRFLGSTLFALRCVLLALSESFDSR